MRRFAHDYETTVKDHKLGNVPDLLKKEAPKPCKAAIPLGPVNQEIYQSSINIKLLKDSGQYLNASEKENRLITQDVTRIFHKKSKPKVVNHDLLHYEFTGDNNLQKNLLYMEEKCTNSSEELQAPDELAELKGALSNAKRTIEILRTENAEQAEKIRFLTKRQKHDQSLKTYNVNRNLEIMHIPQKGILSAEYDSSKNLQRLIEELEKEKMALNLALENSKANESKVVLENSRLKEERKEWGQMQKDLLIAVKVANDFKMEAQKEMLKLSERITELQRRRQSVACNDRQKSSVALYEKDFQSWEDKAWRRLMLGCERGSRRNTLLRWCQEAVAKFSRVEITNFSSSWADGKALCCLLASFYPNKLSIDEACILQAEECLELALSIGAHVGVEVKVKVADFRKEDYPEWSLIMRYALPFEKVDDPIQKTISMQENWYQTITVSIGYFFIIKLIQNFMKHRSAFKLHWPLFIWNLSLALFNIFGFIRFSEQMIHSLLYEGIYRSLCYSVNPTDVAAYWAYLFFWSKVVELGDTLFIILKKKPLMFLHYYHHASVLIYTAHSGAENTGSGKMFIIMNFLVHSAMYTYFAVTSYGIRLSKAISMILTTIQITQMFAGIGILTYIYKIKTETNLPCQQSMQNLLFGTMLYVTFAILFIQYFVSNYFRKSDRKVKDQ